MLRSLSIARHQFRAQELQLLRGHFRHRASANFFTTVPRTFDQCVRHGPNSCPDQIPVETLASPHDTGYTQAAHQRETPKNRFTSTREADESMKESVNLAEITKFAALAETWWDMEGPFKPLHMMNPSRLSFIRSALCRHFQRIPSCAKPLEGMTIVDIGCGGGILSEPLARMGGKVIGIDAVEKNITVARAHAIKDPITASIKYRCTTVEQLVQEQWQFDAVISLEVVEHVTDPKIFLDLLSALVKKGGAVIMSTINRSILGYLLAIIAAEHFLRWLPKGTHEWSKFITPDELALLFSQSGLMLQEMAGMVFNPLTREWALSDDNSVNYIAFGTKSE